MNDMNNGNEYDFSYVFENVKDNIQKENGRIR